MNGKWQFVAVARDARGNPDPRPGFREHEVSTPAWSDIHWREGKLGISAKPDLGFTPKSYEERSVPVPMGLIEALRERKKLNKSLLVFPTLPHPTRPDYGKGNSPVGHMLEFV